MTRKERRRSVLPLPDYTRRKPLAGGRWGYYFTPPSWALKPPEGDDRGPCPVNCEALGTDYDAAVKRVERVLLPLFDSWRTRGLVELAPQGPRIGTLEWLFAEYRGTLAYQKLARKVRALHEAGFALIGGHRLKDGRRLGEIALTSIDAAVVDPLYRKLLPMHDKDGAPLLGPDGTPRERRTTVNHAMKSCRRAWNVVASLHPNEVPPNPFAGMGLISSGGMVKEATYADLLAAVAQADAMGLFSLGTALMLTWEWLQREQHIFTRFELAHYRPRGREREVFIVHPKNGESVWIPLFDASGAALFPELMARMDRLKANRVGNGLFFLRDWIDRRAGVPLPWATKKGALDLMGVKLRAILRATGIERAITFTSFRHGGLTELGDSDLTDAQIRAVSRHKSSKVLTRYVKRTEKQIVEATKKRRAGRPAVSGNDVQFSAIAEKGERR